MTERPLPAGTEPSGRSNVNDARPELTVVLPAERSEMIERTLESLRAQTAAHRLELLIVTPSTARLGLDSVALDGLERTRIVEIGPFERLGTALAEGTRAAAAPIVAMAEGHSYPEPRWAEALLEAHLGPWAAVGAAMTPANPDSTLGWADFLVAFGPYIEPERSRETEALPSHNTSYKREVLLGFDDLERLLETERILHYELRARGERLWLEPGARVRHLNISLPSSWLRIRFAGGRIFAADRARGWSRLRRALYVGGAPLIPVVRLWRIRPDLLRVARRHSISVPRLLAALALALVVEGFGEEIGYAAGAGNTIRPLDAELNRDFHVRGHLAPKLW